MSSERPTLFVPLIAPQIVYPKGPLRRAAVLAQAHDDRVGHITLAQLACGHEVTLAGIYLDPEEIQIRCSVCRDLQVHGDRKVYVPLDELPFPL